jgi:hypothetical protein
MYARRVSAILKSRASSVFFPYASATSPWVVQQGLMPVLVLDF